MVGTLRFAHPTSFFEHALLCLAYDPYNKSNKPPGVHSVNRFSHYFAAIVLLIIYSGAYSQTLNISSAQIINKDTHYQHVIFNLNPGGFIIDNNAILTIEDSVINVTISPDNPNFSLLTKGKLVLKNNIFHVTTKNITPTPTKQSIIFLIRVKNGDIDITNNEFDVNQNYSVGFLYKEGIVSTNNINITNNLIKHFSWQRLFN